MARNRSREAIDNTYDKHCDIIEALEQRDRIAYAYDLNRYAGPAAIDRAEGRLKHHFITDL